MRLVGHKERQFANIVWERAPISSPDLVDICGKELNWKKSTTYTVLKKLCEKGLFRNVDATVTCVISRDEYMAQQSRDYIDEEFGGSFPDFVAAFASDKSLKKEDLEKLKAIIDSFEGDEND